MAMPQNETFTVFDLRFLGIWRRNSSAKEIVSLYPSPFHSRRHQEKFWIYKFELTIHKRLGNIAAQRISPVPVVRDLGSRTHGYWQGVQTPFQNTVSREVWETPLIRNSCSASQHGAKGNLCNTEFPSLPIGSHPILQVTRRTRQL